MASLVLEPLNWRFAHESPQMTASNRPTVDLQALLLIHYISGLIDDECRSEMIPSPTTKSTAMKLLLSVPMRLLGAPDIGAFCGEIHIQWVHHDRQVVVMCFPTRSPLVHHHLYKPNGTSEHGIEAADEVSVTNWLNWMLA